VQPISATAAANYAKNDASLITQIASISAKGGLTFAGVNGNNGYLYNTPKNGFLPRAGLSWQFAHGTVMRAGIGMFQGFLGVRRGNVNQAGFSQNTKHGADHRQHHLPRHPLQPVPRRHHRTGGRRGRVPDLPGQGISYFNQNPKVPRVLPVGVRFTARAPGRFHGAGGLREYQDLPPEITRNLDALPNQYLSSSPFRDNTTNSYLTATVPNPLYGLVPGNSQAIFSNSTIARTGLIGAVSEFSGVSTTTNEGYSWYPLAATGAQKRFTKGLLPSMANYTISKFMQATNLLNAGDPAPVREIPIRTCRAASP